jgi:hypothetical protein
VDAPAECCRRPARNQKSKIKNLKSRAPRLFFNATTRTAQTVVLFVNPLSESQRYRFSFSTVVKLVLLTFRILGAAVFTEPAVAQIEEVSSLMHLV